MPYRSSSKTRQKKDSKRTTMMQAAIRVFAEKGYHAATIRDIVAASDVAIGTFYFYFPDKETLFVHLYDETAEFLLQAIRQAMAPRSDFSRQLQAGLQAYVNIAVYEPAVIQLLLVGGIGATPSLNKSQSNYRERLTAMWQQVVESAMDTGQIVPQNDRRTAEGFAGGFDEVVINLISHPNPEGQAAAAIEDMIQFGLRAAGFTGN